MRKKNFPALLLRDPSRPRDRRVTFLVTVIWRGSAFFSFLFWIAKPLEFHHFYLTWTFFAEKCKSIITVVMQFVWYQRETLLPSSRQGVNLENRRSTSFSWCSSEDFFYCYWEMQLPTCKDWATLEHCCGIGLEPANSSPVSPIPPSSRYTDCPKEGTTVL